MNRVNENFLKLQNNYLFSTVAEKVEKYKQENPEKKGYKFRSWRCYFTFAKSCCRSYEKGLR